MLSKEKQRSHFQKRWKEMLAYLDAFQVSRDPEELHLLRLQLKKIKAQLKFAKNNIPVLFQPASVVFHHAGLIRMAQVNLQLMKDHRVVIRKLQNKQQNIIKTESDLFCKKYDHYIASLKKVHAAILPGFRKRSGKEVSKFFHKNAQKTQRYLDLDVSKWHKARKLLKQLLYNDQLLSKSSKKKIGLNRTYVDRLQEAIGKWHDETLVAKLLERNHAKKGPAPAQGMQRLRLRVMKTARGFSKNIFD